LHPFFLALIIFSPPKVIPLLNWAFQVLRLCFLSAGLHDKN
jgi:hypothetical protein